MRRAQQRPLGTRRMLNSASLLRIKVEIVTKSSLKRTLLHTEQDKREMQADQGEACIVLAFTSWFIFISLNSPSSTADQSKRIKPTNPFLCLLSIPDRTGNQEM